MWSCGYIFIKIKRALYFKATLKYLWNHEEIEYTDGTKTQTTKKVIGVYGDQGIQGLPGKDGAAGNDGADGNDGIGISGIVNYYVA